MHDSFLPQVIQRFKEVEHHEGRVTVTQRPFPLNSLFQVLAFQEWQHHVNELSLVVVKFYHLNDRWVIHCPHDGDFTFQGWLFEEKIERTFQLRFFRALKDFTYSVLICSGLFSKPLQCILTPIHSMFVPSEIAIGQRIPLPDFKVCAKVELDYRVL